VTAEEELATFLGRFVPEVAAVAEAALTRMRARLPGTIEMVYDNYNALVIGYCPTEKPSEAIFSLAMLPDHISLCFLQNAGTLPDPQKLLQGSGSIARHIKLKGPADLDLPAVKALMSEAEKQAMKPFDTKMQGTMVIRSVSAKQRPRR
jgi:hypothetical protein